MTYYQILKKRRLDLNLSIQDIAIQTQLSPEFIRAIEENNLDVFSDDFSFVRYFVHSYADVIGVNWMAIAPEVDASISAYATARDMALTQAQRKMIESMPAAQKSGTTKKKKKRRRKPIFHNLASRISRQMNWDPKNKLSRTVIITGLCILGVLALISMGVDALSERNIENAKLAKQQELKEKEAETQRLADQLKSQKGESTAPDDTDGASSGVIIAPSSDGVNTFVVQGAQSSSINIDFNLASQGTVTVYLNGTAVQTNEFQGAWTYSFQSSADAVIELEITGWQDGDTVSVNQTQVPVDASGFTNGYGVISLVLSAPADAGNDQEQAQGADSSDEENQTDYAEDGSDTGEEQPYEDMGYDDSQAGTDDYTDYGE